MASHGIDRTVTKNPFEQALLRLMRHLEQRQFRLHVICREEDQIRSLTVHPQKEQIVQGKVEV